MKRFFFFTVNYLSGTCFAPHVENNFNALPKFVSPKVRWVFAQCQNKFTCNFFLPKSIFRQEFLSGKTFAVSITLEVFLQGDELVFAETRNIFAEGSNFEEWKMFVFFKTEKTSIAFNFLIESWNYSPATPPLQPPAKNNSPKVRIVIAQIRNKLRKVFLAPWQKYILDKFFGTQEWSIDKPREISSHKTTQITKKLFLFKKIVSDKN